MNVVKNIKENNGEFRLFASNWNQTGAGTLEGAPGLDLAKYKRPLLAHSYLAVRSQCHILAALRILN